MNPTIIPNITNYSLSIPSELVIPCWAAIAVFFITLGIYIHKINSMYKMFPRICDSLTRISEALVQNKISKTPLFSSASPIQLTEKGKEAITACKFEEFLEANKKLILSRVHKNSPKTMADLEEACKSTMLQIENDLPKFENIKQYAYQNGIAITDILFACAIKLRDILSEELNIKT